MSRLERLLYSPASARGIVGTRAIIAAHALWILCSRPCLTDLFLWPGEFWTGVSHSTALRYGWFLGMPERALFLFLLALLPLSVISRAASISAAVLLYHFAPLEDAMIGWPGPYLRGLTVDVLALTILAFAPRIRSEASGNFRWPVVLVRYAVSAQYTFAAIAQLRSTGIEWFSGENIQNLARTYAMVGVAPHPGMIIEHPALAAAIGAGWLLLSFGMMIAAVSRRTAFVVVPLVAIAHLVAAWLFGILWLAAPLLLVFIDFDQRTIANSSVQRASA